METENKPKENLQNSEEISAEDLEQVNGGVSAGLTTDVFKLNNTTTAIKWEKTTNTAIKWA